MIHSCGNCILGCLTTSRRRFSYPCRHGLYYSHKMSVRLQVYVGVAKRKTLAALDLRPEYAQWLTTDENEARIQVLTLREF